jgi:two-component system chemotaxis sensor kinase CheA
MTHGSENSGRPADDMAEYLQTFLDETDEQLDDLVETMLALEQDPTNKDELNEAFRLIHSMKGSAGMMGLESISVLTHHLENRFERFRSGSRQLDDFTMNLVLRCIDFLRQCNSRLRNGEQLGSSTELLADVKELEERSAAPPITESAERAVGNLQNAKTDATVAPPSEFFEEGEDSDAAVHMIVRFRAGLQLSDLKAQLIVARLSGLGEVKSTRPEVDQLADVDQLANFEVWMETHEPPAALRAVADVDGVESIEIVGTAADSVIEVPVVEAAAEGTMQQVVPVEPEHCEAEGAALHQAPAREPDHAPAEAFEPIGERMEASEAGQNARSALKVAETMRVDIDRLDNLMNLAGELVVNRARFIQIAGQLRPELRKASMLNRIRDFSDSLRRTITSLEDQSGTDSDRSAQTRQLRAGLDLLEEQSAIWENGRHCIGLLGEAIDQLSQVSHGLQRGVLGTRMVPVGPLFNRFKRVVRELSKARGKKVDLAIRGETTELDKRMIDELGDPLVHLVRNAIDHGLEPPDVRLSHGKPEAGAVYLEARPSGNNVYIYVRDDGGGIDVPRIKARLFEMQILSKTAAHELSDVQTLEYIWHPGLSTAKEVTDVSGRGVGMDVVKTRITQLNGTVAVESTRHRGTTFTIRLPLTLAIINSLLVRLRQVIFSMPIDDVREIVSVNERDIIIIHQKRTFEVRGEFIPLFQIEDVFHWHGIDYGYMGAAEAKQQDSTQTTVQVVILHTGGRTIGLCVDELLGSQDIVIKSLSDNFIPIRGLSGASILGDGSVCLMLDVSTLIDLAIRSAANAEMEGVVR